MVNRARKSEPNLNRRALAQITRPLSDIEGAGEAWVAVFSMEPDALRTLWKAVGEHFPAGARKKVERLIREMEWGRDNGHLISDDVLAPYPPEFEEHDKRLLSIISSFTCIDLEPVTRRPVKPMRESNSLVDLLYGLWQDLCLTPEPETVA